MRKLKLDAAALGAWLQSVDPQLDTHLAGGGVHGHNVDFVNWPAAIEELGGADAVLRIANEARPPASYLLNTFLPEREMPTYRAEDAQLVIRATMAQLTGMDSAYPEGGAMDVGTFSEKIAKLSHKVTLTEQARRTIREMVERFVLQRREESVISAAVITSLLNFINKLLLQPHFDRREWLRGQVLCTGGIDWTSNGIPLVLDYSIPDEHKFPTRLGTDAYGGTTSKWWEDHRKARRLLRGTYTLSLAHQDTVDDIRYNSANELNTLSADNGRYVLQRFRGSLERASTNADETMVLVAYNGEGEIRDPNDPSKLIRVPFMERGVVVDIGAGAPDESLLPIGQGSTADPDARRLEIGYTHVGPTEENNGAMGTWARVYTPENMPMQLVGESVSNSLPVVYPSGRRRIVIRSTALSA